MPDNLQRVVRHPMLKASLLWSLPHLLSNSGNPSMLLSRGYRMVCLDCHDFGDGPISGAD